MREAIARHMQQSKQTAPHYYLTDDVDMTEAMHMRAQINESLDESERVSVNDLILLATARALLEHPRFNAHWVEDHLQLHSQVNLGIAVALDDGLVAPAIIDCGRKGLKQIAGEARAVAERARDGRLSPEEYSAPTFTVSNLGAFGVDVLVPIINPPQVGILGIGAVREKPVVRNGEVIVRQMMSVVLASDHRATDGAEGARFLATLRQYLEVPGLLLG
jgi:pyruvate dehydrogenase E2 component (dihydrolipoamide acetyltransferase)